MLKKKQSKYAEDNLKKKYPLEYCKLVFKDNISIVFRGDGGNFKDYKVNILKIIKIWLHNGDVVITFITDLNGKRERFNGVIYDKKINLYAKIINNA